MELPRRDIKDSSAPVSETLPFYHLATYENCSVDIKYSQDSGIASALDMIGTATRERDWKR
jgi:hypothetical protein